MPDNKTDMPLEKARKVLDEMRLGHKACAAVGMAPRYHLERVHALEVALEALDLITE